MAIGGQEIWPRILFNNMMVPSIGWSGLMRDVLQHPGLKKISLTQDIYTKFSKFSEVVDADLLTQVFAKMEEFEIHDFPRAEGHPTKCLVDAVLNRLNKLKRLLLKGEKAWC